MRIFRCLTLLLLLCLLSTGAWAQSTLYPDEELRVGESLVSENGVYHLSLQDDGNLVLYRQGQPLWATSTQGSQAASLKMQTDGNLVLYNNFGQPVWSSDTVGDDPLVLMVGENGELGLYKIRYVKVKNLR